MKFISISVLMSFLSVGNSMAQDGYLATDTSISHGQIIDQGIFRNNREVKFAKSKKTPFATYYPKDIKEFGIGTNKYFTKIVDDEDSKNLYFLLKPINGDLGFYILKTRKGIRFFGESNNKMKELLKDSFKDTISTLVTNNYLDNSITVLKHNQRSLSRFFLLHNKSYQGMFPTFRKGIFFSLSNSSISISFENKVVSLGNDLSSALGGFIEFPVGFNPRWFLNTQIFYQKNSYSRFFNETNRNLDYLINKSTINVPVLLKYRSTATKIRSFMSIGPTITYYTKNDNELYISTTTGSVVEIDKVNLNSVSKNQISGTLSLGLEYSLTQKKSLSIEFRYLNGIGLSSPNNQSVSGIQIITSAYF